MKTEQQIRRECIEEIINDPLVIDGHYKDIGGKRNRADQAVIAINLNRYFELTFASMVGRHNLQELINILPGELHRFTHKWFGQDVTEDLYFFCNCCNHSPTETIIPEFVVGYEDEVGEGKIIAYGRTMEEAVINLIIKYFPGKRPQLQTKLTAMKDKINSEEHV